MKPIKNNVDVLGTEHTIDFEEVMNNYTSSFAKCFTEGYLRVLGSFLEKQNLKPEEVKEMVNAVKSSTPKTSETQLNNGFGKLKNDTLRSQLEQCETVKFDQNQHITIKELGFNSIYELDKRSKKKWNEYFSKYNVYRRKGVQTKKISPMILFDKSIQKYFRGRNTELTANSVSSPC